MWYSLLADLLLAIHIAYVAYILLGLVLIWVGLWRRWNWVRSPWFRLTHFAAILIVVLELIFKTSCPLTVWELELRSLAGQTVSEATFIARLMRYLLFIMIPGWMAQLIYIGFALAIVLTFILAPPRWNRGKQSS
ncbi:MAG TPA: DUF2784 domain-containing protein [Pyrinomonadaceae bacterium]|nr:DUF2784 domain-containing protein [Pyrinomonadaceae bacterium]